MIIKIMSEEEGPQTSARVNHSTSVNKIIHAVIPTMIFAVQPKKYHHYSLILSPCKEQIWRQFSGLLCRCSKSGGNFQAGLLCHCNTPCWPNDQQRLADSAEHLTMSPHQSSTSPAPYLQYGFYAIVLADMHG